MQKDDVIAILRANRSALADLDVGSLRLFGSYSRDAAREDSDVDLMVRFREPATFDRFMDLKLYLETLLGRRVDLVTEAAVRPELRLALDREAIRVA